MTHQQSRVKKRPYKAKALQAKRPYRLLYIYIYIYVWALRSWLKVARTFALLKRYSRVQSSDHARRSFTNWLGQLSNTSRHHLFATCHPSFIVATWPGSLAHLGDSLRTSISPFKNMNTNMTQWSERYHSPSAESKKVLKDMMIPVRSPKASKLPKNHQARNVYVTAVAWRGLSTRAATGT